MSALPHLLDEDEPEDAAVAPYRWTRAKFHAALAAGIFTEEDPIELIDGEVIKRVSPQSIRHANAVYKTTKALERVQGPNSHVRAQFPVAVSEDSEPEPDVAVVVGQVDDFQDHPRGSAILLAVEIAESSFHLDRRKANVYAAAGIPEYWLLSLAKNQLLVHRAPSATGYGEVTILEASRSVRPLFNGEAEILVSDLLPKA
jgi:Uma2 family endonuclease